MSKNRGIKDSSKPTARQPDSGVFKRGQNFADQFMNDYGSDELADALRGFKERLHERIEEHMKKMDITVDNMNAAKNEIA